MGSSSSLAPLMSLPSLPARVLLEVVPLLVVSQWKLPDWVEVGPLPPLFLQLLPRSLHTPNDSLVADEKGSTAAGSYTSLNPVRPWSSAHRKHALSMPLPPTTSRVSGPLMMPGAAEWAVAAGTVGEEEDTTPAVGEVVVAAAAAAAEDAVRVIEAG